MPIKIVESRRLYRQIAAQVTQTTETARQAVAWYSAITADMFA